VLPFTTSEFFAVFASYNEAIWPLQLAPAALGVGVVALLLCRPAWSHRAITAIIGALWLLMGLGYHWSFFTVINDAAYGFAGLFVLGALVFLVEGTVRGRIRFAVRLDGWSVIAAVLVAYALILYPVIGLAGAQPIRTRRSSRLRRARRRSSRSPCSWSRAIRDRCSSPPSRCSGA
jgi:hypothetical protein